MSIDTMSVARQHITNNGVAILGVPIDGVPMEQAIRRIEEFIRQGTFHQLATANVDFLVQALTNREYKQILCKCDLVVADGMPLIVASRLLGNTLPERVTGSDLVPRLGALSREKGYGIFLLGAQPDVSEAAARAMEASGAHIVGRLAPPLRPVGQHDDKEILDAIEKAKPDILLVAFGSPKQELWIDRNRHRLKVPVCIGIGASLDFVSGRSSRAPVWMQRAGLEWLHRFMAEPRRLGPRYFSDALCMIRYFSVQLAFHLAKRGRQRDFAFEFMPFGATAVLVASGTMTGPGLAAFERAALAAAEKLEMLVIDMEEVRGLGADGMRILSRVHGAFMKRNVQFHLAGLTPFVARCLRASRCEELTMAPVTGAVARPLHRRFGKGPTAPGVAEASTSVAGKIAS
jgi:N-acetylglucosaminyldiphosphoundecaprenol N-acetyl-beta-D-mannosaminyltransferase